MTNLHVRLTARYLTQFMNVPKPFRIGVCGRNKDQNHHNECPGPAPRTPQNWIWIYIRPYLSSKVNWIPFSHTFPSHVVSCILSLRQPSAYTGHLYTRFLRLERWSCHSLFWTRERFRQERWWHSSIHEISRSNDEEGRTPLHLAAESGKNIAMMNLLLKHGADACLTTSRLRLNPLGSFISNQRSDTEAQKRLTAKRMERESRNKEWGSRLTKQYKITK